MTSKFGWKIKPLPSRVSINFLTRIMNLQEKIVPNISILNILTASKSIIFCWIKPNLNSQKWTLHAVTQNSSFSLTYLKKEKENTYISLAWQLKKDNSDWIYYILCFVLCSITLKSKLTENLVQHFYSLTKHFNQYA